VWRLIVLLSLGAGIVGVNTVGRGGTLIGWSVA
jgi:hypothetical protein